MQVAGSNNTLINMSKHWIQYSRKQRCNDNTLQYPVVFTNKSQCSSISNEINRTNPSFHAVKQSRGPCISLLNYLPHLLYEHGHSLPEPGQKHPQNDVRHTDKFEDYWQTFRSCTKLYTSSKANNASNTKQNRKTNQKPMTKSYPTLPKWNIAPESKGWSRFTNIVPGLWLLVSGRWKKPNNFSKCDSKWP